MNMKQRPPIIAILGHVDHGKTTLLDYIRKTSIAQKESGGITQTIGAYEIKHDDKKMTFVDTPGHEAFSAMRSRGADLADLAVLVIAADDGVKPQTKEALKYIKEADIPFIIAVNKIDLPGAEVEKTLNELTKEEIYLEGRGGDVSYQEISALQGKGIDDLLDLINLASEIEELEYDPKKSAEGVVLNSFNDSKRGVVAGLVIKDGKLNEGDKIFTPSTKGKVRTLENFIGKRVDSLIPSSPALVLGFEDIPKVGEVFKVGEKPDTEEDTSSPVKELKTKKEDHIGVLLKSNETGSLEVLEGLVNKLSSEDVPITIVKSGVGNITEGDVKMAFSTDSMIIGFNVKADKETKNLAKAQKVNIMTSSVIYDLEKQLSEIVENATSEKNRVVQVLAKFSESKNEQTVGGMVARGYVLNKEKFDVVYEKERIGKGRIVNLQSDKEDVNRADEGDKVGIIVEANCDIQKGALLLFSS